MPRLVLNNQNFDFTNADFHRAALLIQRMIADKPAFNQDIKDLVTRSAAPNFARARRKMLLELHPDKVGAEYTNAFQMMIYFMNRIRACRTADAALTFVHERRNAHGVVRVLVDRDATMLYKCCRALTAVEHLDADWLNDEFVRAGEPLRNRAAPAAPAAGIFAAAAKLARGVLGLNAGHELIEPGAEELNEVYNALAAENQPLALEDEPEVEDLAATRAAEEAAREAAIKSEAIAAQERIEAARREAEAQRAAAEAAEAERQFRIVHEAEVARLTAAAQEAAFRREEAAQQQRLRQAALAQQAFRRR